MKRQEYLVYGLAALMLATIVVSAIGTITSLSIAGAMPKPDGQFAGISVAQAAEPTIETAKVKLFVRGDAHE